MRYMKMYDRYYCLISSGPRGHKNNNRKQYQILIRLLLVSLISMSFTNRYCDINNHTINALTLTMKPQTRNSSSSFFPMLSNACTVIFLCSNAYNAIHWIQNREIGTKRNFDIQQHWVECIFIYFSHSLSLILLLVDEHIWSIVKLKSDQF